MKLIHLMKKRDGDKNILLNKILAKTSLHILFFDAYNFYSNQIFLDNFNKERRKNTKQSHLKIRFFLYF